MLRIDRDHTMKKLILALILLPSVAFAGPLTGKATVVDGDTIIVSGVTVRLKGVDAPELGRDLGQSAKEAMEDIIGSETVSCDLTGEKTHGREVGYCRVISGVDINREIIREGHALACPRYSDRYMTDEDPDAVETIGRSSYCITRATRSDLRINSEAIANPGPAVRERPRPKGIVCMYPDDLDRAGRRCGNRAASVRAGGY